MRFAIVVVEVVHSPALTSTLHGITSHCKLTYLMYNYKKSPFYIRQHLNWLIQLCAFIISINSLNLNHKTYWLFPSIPFTHFLFHFPFINGHLIAYFFYSQRVCLLSIIYPYFLLLISLLLLGILSQNNLKFFNIKSQEFIWGQSY